MEINLCTTIVIVLLFAFVFCDLVFSHVWMCSFDTGVSRHLSSFSLVFKVLSASLFLCVVSSMQFAMCVFLPVLCYPCFWITKDCYLWLFFIYTLLCSYTVGQWKNLKTKRKNARSLQCFFFCLFFHHGSPRR